MSKNYKPVLPLNLEDKKVICRFSDREQIVGHVEFVDDTGNVFIELADGRNIALNPFQIEIARNSRGGVEEIVLIMKN